MTTIHDVAKRANVSTKTVSRVLNKYDHISARTREKVERAMEELNYAPSAIARQMRMGDNLSIGVLFSDPGSGYQSELNHALLKACAESHRYLAVELFDEKDADWRGQVDRFLSRSGVSNIVLIPPICDSEAVHDLLRERETSFVLVSPSRPVAGASAVAMDDRKAAFEVVQHLISHGHKRIAHIAGRSEHIVTVLRRQGWHEALQAANLAELNEDLVVDGEFSFRKALLVAESLLSQENPPTAVFAANDHMAVAVMMAAHKMGLRVPEDLSIAGFDNTPMGRSIWPSLTTVAQPFELLSKSAVELLSAPIKQANDASDFHILPHEFIIRGSTGNAS